MYKRFIFDVLKLRMQSAPVMLLVGPRQCGKTTLAQLLGKELDMAYVSFDDISTMAMAQFDPIGFVKNQPKPVIIDEAQRAPELFLPIKVDVDKDRQPGRYLLTGSANPLLAPKLGDALTGRIGICNLWPLSQGELRGSRETFIDRLLSDEPWQGNYQSMPQSEIINLVALGGFPAIHTASSEKERQDWCNDYLFNMLQKDVNELSKIEHFSQMPALFYGLANRVGSTLNVDELSRLIHASSSTVRRYMQLLQNLFLLYKLPAWNKNNDKKLVKSPKVYFSDTAFLLHTLGIDEQKVATIPNVLGHMIENFVVMEVVKQATWSQTTPTLYHYRQEKEKGTEVDLVLETRSGKICGIEIKMADMVRGNDLKGLTALKEQAGEAFHCGIVLYTGNQLLRFGDSFWGIPLRALWS